jgi:uncharacterized protein DUF2442
MQQQPRAVSARYDARAHKVVVTFASGAELRFPTSVDAALVKARAVDLAEIVVSPAGQGIYFPKIDVDMLLAPLLLGTAGAAAALGRLGGSAASAAKAHAARENGRRGGRPVKVRVA